MCVNSGHTFLCGQDMYIDILPSRTCSVFVLTGAVGPESCISPAFAALRISSYDSFSPDGFAKATVQIVQHARTRRNMFAKFMFSLRESPVCGCRKQNLQQILLEVCDIDYQGIKILSNSTSVTTRIISCHVVSLFPFSFHAFQQ